jgi:hypothetical protein
MESYCYDETSRRHNIKMHSALSSSLYDHVLYFEGLCGKGRELKLPFSLSQAREKVESELREKE